MKLPKPHQIVYVKRLGTIGFNRAEYVPADYSCGAHWNFHNGATYYVRESDVWRTTP